MVLRDQGRVSAGTAGAGPAKDAYHVPVMGEETVGFLVTERDGAYMDCTLGGGGHARLILERLSEDGRLIALDRDPEAVERARAVFAGEGRLSVRQIGFARLEEAAPAGGLDGFLFDLGISSRQIDARDRGFSFAAGTALDMRMERDQGVTAGELLAALDEEGLARLFRDNADIEESRRLARLVKREVAAELSAGSDPRALRSEVLRRAVEAAHVPPPQRNSLLARLFQALRMEVNAEMDQLEAGLEAAVRLTREGGRICVLSYHSVEDRKVKQVFARHEKSCICPPALPVCRCGDNHRRLRAVVKKPRTASETEIGDNPRARSAKLRVMEKVDVRGGTPMRQGSDGVSE